MSLIDAFNFMTRRTTTDATLPSIYPMSVQLNYFVEKDVKHIYKKILTDVLDRTQGIPEKDEGALWNNCLGSEHSSGLVSFLADAMYGQKDLFLSYNLGVLREASHDEAAKIKSDYEKTGKSPGGVFISFKNYELTDMLKIYSSMEYSVLNSLNKSMNLSAAIQFKMAKMRMSVGGIDKQDVITQAQSIAEGLAEGCDVMLDGEDEIVTSTPDMDSVEKSITFIDSKKCFYLVLPMSYVTGEQSGGIGSTGEGDTKAIDRGLRLYFSPIIKPVCKALFGADVSFKTQDFRMVSQGMEALKTFELVSEDYLSLDNKRLIVAGLFNVQNDIEGPKESDPEIDLDLEGEEVDDQVRSGESN